jgi:hypothetical protein
MNVAVFWVAVGWCSLENTDIRFINIMEGKKASLKRWSVSTRIHVAIPQKIAIFRLPRS